LPEEALMKIYILRSIFILTVSILAAPLFASGDAEQIEDPDLVVQIDGMYCALCSDAVKKSFESNEEVQVVSANHKTGTAYIVLDDKAADIEALTTFFEERLVELGYSLVSVTPGESNG
jgi:copper chaperone CopZ